MITDTQWFRYLEHGDEDEEDECDREECDCE